MEKFQTHLDSTSHIVLRRTADLALQPTTGHQAQVSQAAANPHCDDPVQTYWKT